MDKEEKKRIAQEKWQERADKLDAFSKNSKQVGNKIAGVGCLLTIFVTIPIIILFILLL